MVCEITEAVNYNHKTGLFTWKYRPYKSNSWNARFSGKPALDTVDGHGYRQGRINYKIHAAHRVAWYVFYGVWPDGQIDHINMDKSDNRIENLREATRAENARNRGRQSDNTSGYKGVHWHKATGKWQAKIKVNGKTIYLGLFADPKEAHKSYSDSVVKYHGEFSRIE